MSTATTNSLPVIGNQQPKSALPTPEAVQQDPELMQVAMAAHVQAITGQRDEALAKAAELFSQLNVLEAVAQRLQKENDELKLDIQTLQQAGIPAAS